MNKLFIDTNIFESKGFNFDQKNILIKLLIENAKNKNYEYYNLSVIDKEIISHITDRCSSRKKELFGKFKWIKNYVKETERVIANLEEIKENCRKKIINGFTLNAMAKKFDKIFTDSIKKEKEKKPSHPINSYMEYNLAIESIFIDYFFTVKNYLETKFGIYYDPEKKPRKKGRLYYFKRRISKVLNRAHAKQEALTIANALRCLYKVLYNFAYFLKFFILSIPAAFVLFYKLLMRNKNN